MSKINEPAFPVRVSEQSKIADDRNRRIDVQYPGMTLLDWFAGQAMLGIITGNHADALVTGKDGAVGMAKDAYIVAAAMLSAREKVNHE